MAGREDSAEPLPTGDSIPQPRRMNAYQRLVYDTARAQGLSYAEVARKSGTGANGKPRLSRQRVQQIVELPITRSPGKETIKGLASGLGLSEDTIREAVAETLGLRTLRSGPAAELNEIVEMVEKLDSTDQARWARLARTLAREFIEYPSRRVETPGVFSVERSVDGVEMFIAKIEGQPDLDDETRSELIDYGKRIMGE
jgi:transcriptional regulator with XRE-family HTH domain